MKLTSKAISVGGGWLGMVMNIFCDMKKHNLFFHYNNYQSQVVRTKHKALNNNFDLCNSKLWFKSGFNE